MPSIYEVPLSMQAQKLDAIILRKMNMPVGETPQLGPWRSFLDRRTSYGNCPHRPGCKYDLQDAYKSIFRITRTCRNLQYYKVKTHFVNSEKLTREKRGRTTERYGGSSYLSRIRTTRHRRQNRCRRIHRTHDIPTFGICLGMQMMVIEFARNVLGYVDANSREMDEKTPHNVIDIMEEQKKYHPNGRYDASGSLRNVMYVRAVRLLKHTDKSRFPNATVTATNSTTNILRSMKKPACNA